MLPTIPLCHSAIAIIVVVVVVLGNFIRAVRCKEPLRDFTLALKLSLDDIFPFYLFFVDSDGAESLGNTK